MELPKAITIRDPHTIGRVVAIQLQRRYRTAARALDAIVNERAAQLELEAIGRKLSPLSPPVIDQSDGRAGAATSSRRAKRPAADRSESAA